MKELMQSLRLRLQAMAQIENNEKITEPVSSVLPGNWLRDFFSVFRCSIFKRRKLFHFHLYDITESSVFFLSVNDFVGSHFEIICFPAGK